MASRTRAKLNNINDRAREVGRVDEVLTLADIDALYEFYSRTCLHCGFTPAISPDHVLPLSLGGANTVDNLQLLCDSCNKAKRDKHEDYRNGRILTPEIVADLSKSETKTEKTSYKKHDWDAIEFEYIHAVEPVSLDYLAQKYKVARSHIRTNSIRGRWVEKRIKNRTELGLQAEQESNAMAIDYLASERFNVLREGIDLFKDAVDRWQIEGDKVSLREIVELWKPLAAALGEVTERTAHTDESEPDDDDIIIAAQQIAARADRKAERGDYSRSASNETELGAGWSD